MTKKGKLLGILELDGTITVYENGITTNVGMEVNEGAELPTTRVIGAFNRILADMVVQHSKDLNSFEDVLEIVGRFGKDYMENLIQDLCEANDITPKKVKATAISLGALWWSCDCNACKDG